MTWMVRAVYSLPYEPNLGQMDKVRNLIAGRRLRQVVTSPTLVEVLGSVDDQAKGWYLGKELHAGLQSLLKAKIRGNVHVTALGEKQTISVGFEQ